MQRTPAALLLINFGNSMSLDGAPSPLATMEKKEETARWWGTPRHRPRKPQSKQVAHILP
jgi:hypothetical protein